MHAGENFQKVQAPQSWLVDSERSALNNSLRTVIPTTVS